jgi:prepilin-type N-terminal cleavage/methylation domain-containing protein
MTRNQKRRNGFTLIELTIASLLTALLALMLSTSWVMLNRPTSSLIAWGQLFQEMDIAVTALTRDLGGGLSDYCNKDNPLQEKWLGTKAQGLLVACETNSDGDRLRLKFDGDGSSDPWTITYYVDVDDSDYVDIDDSDNNRNTLVRQLDYTDRDPPNSMRTSIFRVANDIKKMTVVDETPSDPNGNLRITLTFQFHRKYETMSLIRECILITKKKP